MDKNRIPDLIGALEKLNKYRIEIGIFGEDDSQILMIANVHEYGCRIEVTERMRNYLHAIGIHLRADTTEINIPERSYMRSSFDQSVGKMSEKMEFLVEKVLMDKITPEAMFEALGGEVSTMAAEYLTDLGEPPLHPATEQRKGSSNPLVDTGRLRQAITWRVVEDG